MSKNKTIILPLCAFGNIFYYATLLNNRCIIDSYENYQKQTWRNRYDILSPNGMQSLTIPVQSQNGQKTALYNIKIDNRTPWQRTHLRSIKTAYGSAPYYDYYLSFIQDLYDKPHNLLTEFSTTACHVIDQVLGMNNELLFSSHYIQPDDTNVDLRPYFKPVHFNCINHQPITYLQTFADRFEFVPNLSILDLLFNYGPDSKAILTKHQTEAGQFTIFDPQ